jgi:hypothetical protein
MKCSSVMLLGRLGSCWVEDDYLAKGGWKVRLTFPVQLEAGHTCCAVQFPPTIVAFQNVPEISISCKRSVPDVSVVIFEVANILLLKRGTGAASVMACAER